MNKKSFWDTILNYYKFETIVAIIVLIIGLLAVIVKSFF